MVCRKINSTNVFICIAAFNATNKQKLHYKIYCYIYGSGRGSVVIAAYASNISDDNVGVWNLPLSSRSDPFMFDPLLEYFIKHTPQWKRMYIKLVFLFLFYLPWSIYVIVQVCKLIAGLKVGMLPLCPRSGGGPMPAQR